MLMKFLLAIAIFTVILLPQPAEAIIFLPALILMPVIHLLAWLLGLIIVPLSGFLLLAQRVLKLRRTSVLGLGAIFLILILVAAAVFLAYQNPERSFF